tara:strand:- start:474 stop:896 length:423 start_codon:yes stop_codon:yes gene_type:complete
MLTSNFKNIDVNQIATDRQTYGVACHFANIHAASPSERYGLTKVFNAVIKKYYSDADSFMTHGDVSEFREWDCVPEQFLLMITGKKPTKKPKAKAKSKVKAKAKPTASKAPKKESTLTQRVEAMEATQAKILELLEAIAK